MSRKQRSDDPARTELLVQMARLYYEQNLSQNEIAAKVKLSRSYVSKLLFEARETGIVVVKINDPGLVENRYESRLKEYYNLRHVVVLPKESTVGRLQQVGEAVAKYLNSIIKSGDTVGFTWGETIYECSKACPVRDDLKDISFIQLCGGISNTRRNVYVNEIAQNYSQAVNGMGYILPFPAVVSSKEIKNLLDNEPTMQDVASRAGNMDIVIMTMSNLRAQCTMARAGYLSVDEIYRLREKGAVGDVCTHIIDKNGNICDKDLDDRTVAVPLDDIKKIDIRIGAAVGENKVETTIAALEGGIINVLVTNEAMVEMIKAVKPQIFD